MRAHGTTAISLLALCLVASPARAGGTNTVKDGTAFEVDLGVPEVTTCFVFPKERSDAQACDGVNMGPVEAQIASFSDRSKLLAVAILRQQESETMLVVMRTPAEMARVSPGDVEKTARQVLKGMSSAAAEAERMAPTLAKPARLLQVGDLQVLHLSLVMQVSKESQEPAFLMDHFFALTEGGTTVLQFTTMPADMARMQPAMERLIQSLRGRPTQKTESTDDVAYRAGYYFGLFGVPVLLLVGAFVTAYLIGGRSKRRQASR